MVFSQTLISQADFAAKSETRWCRTSMIQSAEEINLLLWSRLQGRVLWDTFQKSTGEKAEAGLLEHSALHEHI